MALDSISDLANVVSHWTLDETSGTRSDSTSNGNDLTDNNTVGSALGARNNGADFEAGNSEYLSITDASQTGLDITGDMSISCWYKPESQPSARHSLVSKWTVASRSYIFAYRNVSGTKKLDLFISSTSGGGGAASVTQTLNNGTMYHLVAVYDASAGSVEFFVDGSSIGSATGLNGSIFNSTAPFYIGAFDNGGPTNFADGIVDEVTVIDRKITSGEVSDLYNSGTPLDYESAGGAAFIPKTVFME